MDALIYERRTLPKNDCWRLCAGYAGSGVLAQSLLVSIHGVRGIEPVSIRLHKLVSDDDVPSADGRKGIASVRRSWLLTALLFCVFIEQASAQVAETLGLTQAVDAALQNSPIIRGAQLGVERSRQTLAEADAGRTPRIGLTQTVTRGNNPVFVFGSLLEQNRFGPANFDVQSLNNPASLTNFRTALSADLTVFNRGTTSRIAQANIGQERAELENRLAEQRVRFDVVTKYFGLALAETELGVTNDALRLAEADVVRARNRVDAGLTVVSDLLAAQVQLAEFKHQQIQSVGHQASALAALNVSIGTPHNAAHKLTTEFRQNNFDVPGTDELVSRALLNRPEYRQSQSAVEIAQHRLAEQGAIYIPEVRVFASAGYSSRNLVAGSTDYTIGAGATFDLLDYGRRARVSQAEVDKQLAETEQSRIADQIRVEVIDAYHRYRAACQQEQVAEAALAQAMEGLRIIQDRYEAGLTTITELLRAEITVVRAQMNVAVARHDQYLGYAGVLLATGDLNDVRVFER
jgi:outer membrane protein TolC